jgi:hypothetical protein
MKLRVSSAHHLPTVSLFVATLSVAPWLLASCQGHINAPPGTEDVLVGSASADGVTSTTPASLAQAVKTACATRILPTQPLLRVSDEQYRNVIVDLFGASLASPLVTGSLFPPTVIKSGFVGDADANVVNSDQSDSISANAERIATTILATPDPYLRALLPCTLPATYADKDIDACADQFIATFGQRAYRRPLTTNETALARRVYDQVRPTQSATAAWASVVQFFVQAPALLYRVERGAGAVPGAPGLIKLTGPEMATRLSFLFLGSGPDATLQQAATAGQLSTPAQVAAQARRLLQDPRFVGVMGAFHRDWLHLYELAAMTKDPTVYPDYTPTVEASQLDENTELGRTALGNATATIKDLLLADEVPVDATLATFYGASAAGATMTAWVPAPVPHRSGLLTSGSVMAALSKVNRSNLIHRGAIIRTAVMCDYLPGLPANIDTATPLEDTASLPTARQRYAPLTTNPQCMPCHLQMNPIGFGFENYDGIGKWRDQENGTTIDASGSLDVGTGPQSFSGPADLVALLAGSDKVRDCYSLQWLRSALGRLEAPEDACSLATLNSLVVSTNGDLREMLVALTQTDAFLYRQPVQQ